MTSDNFSYGVPCFLLNSSIPCFYSFVNFPRLFFDLVIFLYSVYKSYGSEFNFYEFPFIVFTVSFIPASFNFLLNASSFKLIVSNLSFIAG